MNYYLKGIGTDIIEVQRIKQAVEKHGDRILNRLFTPNELAYCKNKWDPYPCYAVRFAAKEAVFKSFGIGLGSLRWNELEILTGLKGKPEVNLLGQAVAFAWREGIIQVLISLSHDRERAIAFALAVGKD